MRPPLTIVAVLGLTLLAACNGDDPCSPDLYAQKNADLKARMAAFSTQDPAKRDAVINGLHAVLDTHEAAGADGDLSATCKAIDDLMAELSK
jgi:hypothetical protein